MDVTYASPHPAHLSTDVSCLSPHVGKKAPKKLHRVLGMIPRKNERRVKLHVPPVEEVKEAFVAAHLAAGTSPKQLVDAQHYEVFLECFYETTTFDLLANGCWLRSRQTLSSSGELSTPAWVWQEKSHQSDEIHAYDEYPPTTNEQEIKSHMARLLKVSSDLSLRELCPRFLARFVTVRCPLSETAWIDRSFFDEAGTETYDVYTFHERCDVVGVEDISPVPTKIMEYLRRFQPVLYKKVRDTEAPHQETSGAVAVAELPPLMRPPSAFADDELPRPTAAQLATIRDPQEDVLLAQRQEYDRKFDQILNEHLERLSQSPDYKGKWVVFAEDSTSPLYAVDSKLEALRWKVHNLRGRPAFVFCAVRSFRRELSAPVLVHSCSFSSSDRRILVAALFHNPAATLPADRFIVTPDLIVDTGDPGALHVQPRTLLLLGASPGESSHLVQFMGLGFTQPRPGLYLPELRPTVGNPRPREIEVQVLPRPGETLGMSITHMYRKFVVQGTNSIVFK